MSREVEGISVPPGDPDALLGGAAQLRGAAESLRTSAARLNAMPSFMPGWAGPSSSIFARRSSQQGGIASSNALQVDLAAMSVHDDAVVLREAQADARKAQGDAETAREHIDQAKRDIAAAKKEQTDAKGRIEIARTARAVAESQLVMAAADAFGAATIAQGAIQAADRAEREAHDDLVEAQRHQHQAEHRLDVARQDLRDAQKLGREAAKSAHTAGQGVVTAMMTMPPGTFASYGTPGSAKLGAASGAAHAREDLPDLTPKKQDEGSAFDGLSGFVSGSTLGLVDLGGNKESARYKRGDVASYIPINPAGAVKDVGKIGAKVVAKDVAKAGEKQAAEGATHVVARGPRSRPSWRQTEKDVEAELAQRGYKPQASFKDGVDARHGEKGSVRPDLYTPGRSVELKNYSVESSAGRSRLVRNVAKQVETRAQHLPSGTTQEVRIDVRGQDISMRDADELARRIVERTGGKIDPRDVRFMRDDG